MIRVFIESETHFSESENVDSLLTDFFFTSLVLINSEPSI